MRFIYEWNDNYKTSSEDFVNNSLFMVGEVLKEYGSYTIEDTQDNIIWLIKDEKSYEEMREYYVKD